MGNISTGEWCVCIPHSSASFLIYLVLSLWLPNPTKIPPGFTNASVYLLANMVMLPGIAHIVPMIVVAWSLSYEWLFYLLLPPVVLALDLRRRTPLWRVWFFAAITLLYEIACLSGLADHPRMIMFAVGILLWETQQSGRLWKMEIRGEWLAILGFLSVLLIIGFFSHRDPAQLILSVPPLFYAPLLFVSTFFFTAYALFHDGLLKLVFSWRSLRWLGNMSYSFYLVHGLTLHGLKLLAQSFLPGEAVSPLRFVCLFVVCLAVALLVSATLYRVLEKPFLSARPAQNTSPTLQPEPSLSA